MLKIDKRYCLGSIISVNGVSMGEIKALSGEGARVLYKTGIEEEVPWTMIFPVSLDVSYLPMLGFKEIQAKKHEFHVEYVFEKRIQGKFYGTRGVIFENKALWYFNTLVVKYIHQVQNLIWTIDPQEEFTI